MNKIALNIICKNESHIILEMLGSVSPVIDLIVALDTGSDDATISVIREFGRSSGIPTFVFERPFDNFGNSRNYAIDCLIKVCGDLGVPADEVWGLSIDCDETLVVSDRFSKDQLAQDVYLVPVRGTRSLFYKNALFHLSKDLRWDGPVHETIAWSDPGITSGTFDSVHIIYGFKGDSWKGDQEGKFVRYAKLLADHVSEGHLDCKTLINAGRSYGSAAEYCKSVERAKEHRSEAKRYYEMASNLEDLSRMEKLNIYSRLAKIKDELNEDWNEIQDLYMRSYALDHNYGETIEPVILHYMDTGQWNLAYLYSSFAKPHFHGNTPPVAVGVVMQTDLYRWEFLLYHSICAYMIGKKEEAKRLREELTGYVNRNIKSFSMREVLRSRSNTPFNLTLRYWRTLLFNKRQKMIG